MVTLVVLSTSVLALYGGEYIPYTISKCEKLMINITNSNLNEWNVTPYCHEDFNGSFYCACSNSYKINLTSKPNSFGNYTINITNFWSETQSGQQTQYTSSVSFSPPSSSGYVFRNYTINVTQSILKEVTKNITVEKIVKQNVTVNVTSTEPNKTNLWYITAIGFLALLSIGLGIILLLKRKKESFTPTTFEAPL